MITIYGQVKHAGSEWLFFPASRLDPCDARYLEPVRLPKARVEVGATVDGLSPVRVPVHLFNQLGLGRDQNTLAAMHG